jgi:hypothetical protein
MLSKATPERKEHRAAKDHSGMNRTSCCQRPLQRGKKVVLFKALQHGKNLLAV